MSERKFGVVPQIYDTANQLGKTLFNKEIPAPVGSSPRPWVLDDTNEFVIYPGSLLLPEEVQADDFLQNTLSLTHDLLHRSERQDRVVSILRAVAGLKMPLFPPNYERDKSEEIQDNFVIEGLQTESEKHEFMMTNTVGVVREAYINILAHGLKFSDRRDIGLIAENIRLNEHFLKIDNSLTKGQLSYEDALMKAYMAVSERASVNYKAIIKFFGAGINEGVKVSAATINGLYTAIPEWNKTNPDEQLDFYEFAQTEGKKWITLMATGHIVPTFQLLRGLCGDSYDTDFPTFPDQVIGIAKLDGVPKIGFRLGALTEEQKAYLQTMQASHFSTSPRTKCPAVGIFAEDLYLRTLGFYKKCMF